MISDKAKRTRVRIPARLSNSRFSLWRRLKEIDMFFQENDPVHQTARRTVRRFERARIRYAIAGGIAVNAHSCKRTTADVDFLLNKSGFERFCTEFVGKYYDRVPGRSRRFVERKTGVAVDILVTGLYPGSGKPGPIAFPDPSNVSEKIGGAQVLNLVTLVQLKLAARRHRDFGDVVELIRYNQLDESFGLKLHSAVRRDFTECLEEKRREDEYEARNG